MRTPWTHGLAGHASGAWPALIVVLGVVLVPTACVLWFMNEAVRNERMAVRQKLTEVYRQDLENCQPRVDEHWQSVQAALAAAASKPPAQAFKELVEAGTVGSALIYREGRLAYPVVGVSYEDGDGEASAMSRQGRALQAEARDLARAGGKERAVEMLATTLQQDAYRGARDASGRLIAPDAALFAMEVMAANDPRRPGIVRALAGRLRDYGGAPMPSAQRLFLMRESAGRTGELFATMAGEEVALELLERIGEGRPPVPAEARSALVRVPGLSGTWDDGGCAGRRGGGSGGASRSRNCSARSPGRSNRPWAQLEFREDGMAWDATHTFMVVHVGRYMPRWFMTLRLTGTDPFAVAAKRQEAVYLWTGGVGVAAIAFLGAAMGMYLRRQMRLTRLKNDLTATVSHELKTPAVVDARAGGYAGRRTVQEPRAGARVSGAHRPRERPAEPADRQLPHLLAHGAEQADVRAAPGGDARCYVRGH